ncbi:MAG: rifamycin-inactivating phosphotransferase [Pseudomonadota bacterium]
MRKTAPLDKAIQVDHYVLDISQIDQTQVSVVGGKGAHLGELARIEGISVPPGFCITTHAFVEIIAKVPSLAAQLEHLAKLKLDDQQLIRTFSAEIRRTIEDIAIPDDLAVVITSALTRHGEQAAYAVRSSATAEDLPTASFAGQQDTYLNVVGPSEVLRHVSSCWASLFTERAVTYRVRNGFDHRRVQMAVVVQQMIFPQASGILFTADPVTGNRKISTVDASFGLGEALVSGLVNPDTYRVRDNKIIARTIATKRFAIYATPEGGTQEQVIEAEQQGQPALTDAQVIRLVQLGRLIEAHFGRPQDIEWCLLDDNFEIVQSRSITTLFPIPAVNDGENHVYISVGHAQMMTDAMKPLGLAFWQLTTPRAMAEAGGRLFVDVTANLASPKSRASLLEMFGKYEPLVTDALRSVVDRGDFIRLRPDENPGAVPEGRVATPIEADAAIVTELIERSEASINALKGEIKTKSGSDLLDFIFEDLKELKRIMFDPQSHQVYMTAMNATDWLNENMQAWLGEKSAADTLAQSVPNNVTSEMGLALLDVADVIRPYPEVIAKLAQIEDDNFLVVLPQLAGGAEARAAIETWLDKYGMRGVGEIDITRPRWSERPSMLVPLILGNVRNFAPGAAKQRFEQGLQEARKKERELLERLRVLPDGEQKMAETKRMIDRVRTFIGYREYPKYRMISRYFVYKQALLAEAARLLQANVIRESDDIFYLTFQELRDVVLTHEIDNQLVRERKNDFVSWQALKPPRLLTSDGEGINGSYRRDNLPPGALVGLPVSAGTIEGRARVILDVTKAHLEPGDILVTAYTDPSWTPLFVAITGLVTEVGGLMTHGAVIAREYGLPAIVGVERATQLIRDGQRIRVNGTDGYIELLS